MMTPPILETGHLLKLVGADRQLSVDVDVDVMMSGLVPFLLCPLVGPEDGGQPPI